MFSMNPGILFIAKFLNNWASKLKGKFSKCSQTEKFFIFTLQKFSFSLLLKILVIFSLRKNIWIRKVYYLLFIFLIEKRSKRKVVYTPFKKETNKKEKNRCKKSYRTIHFYSLYRKKRIFFFQFHGFLFFCTICFL